MKPGKLLFALLFLTGCRGDMNDIHYGMSPNEVESILGKPNEITKTSTIVTAFGISASQETGARWDYGSQGSVFFHHDTVVDVKLFP